MNVSYEEIGQILITCPATNAVQPGQVVKMNANGVVEPCAAGDKICGLALSVASDGYAAVQVRGFASLPCTDSSVTPGWVTLAADGNCGVAAGAEGASLLVVKTDGQTAVACL